jgi:hypothetical protein
MEDRKYGWKIEDRQSRIAIIHPRSSTRSLSLCLDKRGSSASQRIAKQVEAHQREEDKQSRQKNLQRRDENIRRRVGQQIAPARRRRLNAETEKAQRRSARIAAPASRRRSAARENPAADAA